MFYEHDFFYFKMLFFEQNFNNIISKHILWKVTLSHSATGPSEDSQKDADSFLNTAVCPTIRKSMTLNLEDKNGSKLLSPN